MNAKAVTVRFHLEHEADRNAWERLQDVQQQQHLSLNRAIIFALNEATLKSSSAKAPMGTPKQFAEDVMSELQGLLPPFIAGCIAGQTLSVPALPLSPVPTPSPIETGPSDDAEPDFGSSLASWDFLGG